MSGPRRALPRSRALRVREWLLGSWVPAAIMSGLCLVLAGLWPIGVHQPAPLPPATTSVGPHPDRVAAPRAETRDQAAGRVGTPSLPRPSHTAGGARLIVGSLGISAPLQTVGVRDGELEIPEDPEHVGLWSHGAQAGDGTGTVLVTGHVAWNGERGAMWALARAVKGDIVELVAADGSATQWLVASAHSVIRDADHPELFTRSGRHRLVLVTCGGPVVNGRYRDLVVVEALPA